MTRDEFAAMIQQQEKGDCDVIRLSSYSNQETKIRNRLLQPTGEIEHRDSGYPEQKRLLAITADVELLTEQGIDPIPETFLSSLREQLEQEEDLKEVEWLEDRRSDSIWLEEKYLAKKAIYTYRWKKTN